MAYTITAKQLIETIATAADNGTDDNFISQLQSLFSERYGQGIDLVRIKDMVNVMRCAYELVRTHMHPGFICADTSMMMKQRKHCINCSPTITMLMRLKRHCLPTDITRLITMATNAHTAMASYRFHCRE